ncbi:MAG: hypothetical protein JST00_07360 [Deltaproteobacteria bacterium]|nr:hypothetical protein [Deltaproteobacteria bacterium]
MEGLARCRVVALVGVTLAAALAACGAPAGSTSSPSSGASPELARACQLQREKRSFDRGCGAVAMRSARTAECHRASGGGAARVHVKVTFAPSGTVTHAVADLAQPPEAMPEVEACIVARFRELVMPPFDGPPVVIGTFVDVR